MQKYLDIAEVMIVIIDPEERVSYVNRKTCEVLGFEEEKIVGKNWFESFIPPKLRAELRKVFQEILEGKMELAEYHENPILTSRGEEKLIAWHNTVLRDESGKIYGTLSSGEDITERKALEKSLKESEERYRSYFESVSDIFFMLSPNLTVLEVSPSVEKVLGYRPEEIVGKKIRDLSLLTPESKKSAIDFASRFLSGENPGMREYDFITKDGKRKTGEIHGAPLVKDEKVVALIFAARDISHHKETEKALQESERRYRTLFENVPIGIYRTTPDGRIIDVNPALLQMLGYPDRNALLSLKASDLYVNPGDRQRLIFIMGKEGIIRDFVFQMRRRDGTPIWVRDNARAVRDKEGRILYYEGTLENITEQKRAQEDISWLLQVRTALAELSGKLLHPTSIEEISSLVLEHAKSLTGSTLGYVGYIDPEKGFLVCPAMTREFWEECRVQDKDTPYHSFRGLWGWVLNNKKSLLSNSPGDDSRSVGVPPGHIPIGRFLSVPAMLEESLVGQIAVANSLRDYTEEDLDVMERLAELYALAVQRKRMEEELHALALVDELTGLNNRRGFSLLAEQQIKLADRMKKNLLLLFLDLDQLKRINDDFGHQEGDRALKEIAEVLKTIFRKSDILARIGGDEFVVLVLETKKRIAEILVARLLQKLASRGREKPYKLSVSIGVAEYDPKAPCSLEELINQADRLMYKEKSAKLAQRS